MASALQNPNDRRRINLIARQHVKQGTPVKILVEEWRGSNGKKNKRPAWMQRNKALATALKQSGGAKNSNFFGKARKQTKAEKAKYAAAKASVARAFEALGGVDDQGRPRYGVSGARKAYSYTTKDGRTVKVRAHKGKGYAKRAGGSHASRYLLKAKKVSVPARKGQFNKKGKVVLVDVDGVRAWDATRIARGAQGLRRTSPWPGGASGARRAGSAKPARKTKSKQKAVANGLALRNGLALTNGLALSNPLGGLALTNPKMGAKSYFLGYALPVTIAGAAAGGIHAVASTSGLTAKISDLVEKIPGVGPKIAEHAPYTLQGLLLGSGLAILAPMIGGAAGKYLALAGGAAIVVGGGIDTFNYAIGRSEAGDDADFSDALDFDLDADLSSIDDSDMGVDLSGVSALGDLAFTNVSALGDGMAYETAPLSAAASSEDYGQASLVDAQYSGADFSVEEGEALLNGRRSFAQRFGNPPMRMSGRPTAGPSHLAGRDGHRWGWLVRMIGWQKASAIAALPAKRRVQFLKKLRQAAVASYTQLMQEAQVLQAETQSANAEFRPAAGYSASGATGATGGTNYLGEPALFMGA